jgi:hypothetical protein
MTRSHRLGELTIEIEDVPEAEADAMDEDWTQMHI